MGKRENLKPIVLVFLIVAVLQVLLIWADTRDTPSKAVTAFARSYFSLNGDMSRRLCADALMRNGINQVEQYIYHVSQEAKARGFRPWFFKNHLYHVRTEVLSLKDGRAEVRLTAVRKAPLRSLFTGESHEVEAILHVIRVDGKWKVCGHPFTELRWI